MEFFLSKQQELDSVVKISHLQEVHTRMWIYSSLPIPFFLRLLGIMSYQCSITNITHLLFSHLTFLLSLHLFNSPVSSFDVFYCPINNLFHYFFFYIQIYPSNCFLSFVSHKFNLNYSHFKSAFCSQNKLL